MSAKTELRIFLKQFFQPDGCPSIAEQTASEHCMVNTEK